MDQTDESRHRYPYFIKVILSLLVTLLAGSLFLIELNLGDVEKKFEEVMGIGSVSKFAFLLYHSPAYYIGLVILLGFLWASKRRKVDFVSQSVLLLVGTGTTMLTLAIWLKVALIYLPFSSLIARVLLQLNVQNL
jgi:hypothetical protein